MTKPRSFLFSQFCAWGLTGSCAVLGLAGVVGMFTPGGDFLGLDRTEWCVIAFALVMAFAIAGVNTMADAVMHAIDVEGGWRNWHWPTLIPAALAAVGLATFSNIGVHLGWELLAHGAAVKDRLPDADTVRNLFLALTCMKPAEQLAIAGRKAMDRKKAEAEKAAADARADARDAAERGLRHEENLARIHAETPAPASHPPSQTAAVTDLQEERDTRRKRRAGLVETVMMVGAAAMAANGATPETAHAETLETRPAPGADAARDITVEDIRRGCATLQARGVRPSYRNVAEELGVPRSRIERTWPKGVKLAA